MNPVWVVPVVVAVVGTATVALLLRQAAREAQQLRMGLVRFGEVRLALARVRDETVVTRAALDAVRATEGPSRRR